MHETGQSKPVHWNNLRDGMGRELRGGFRMRDTCIPIADSCQRMAKNPYNIVKQLASN